MEDVVNPPEECYLLTRLPPELRLRIYEFVFYDQVSLVLYITSTLRLLRAKLKTRTPPLHYTALLQTCKTINREATPYLYGNTIFSVFVYTLSRERNYEDLGTLRSTTLLRFVRQIHFHFWDVNLQTINVFLLQLKALADALKTNTRIQTCSVRFRPPIGLMDVEAAKVVKLNCDEAMTSTTPWYKGDPAAKELYGQILNHIDRTRQYY